MYDCTILTHSLVGRGYSSVTGEDVNYESHYGCIKVDSDYVYQLNYIGRAQLDHFNVDVNWRE